MNLVVIKYYLIWFDLNCTLIEHLQVCSLRIFIPIVFNLYTFLWHTYFSTSIINIRISILFHISTCFWILRQTLPFHYCAYTRQYNSVLMCSPLNFPLYSSNIRIFSTKIQSYLLTPNLPCCIRSLVKLDYLCYYKSGTIYFT